MLFRSHDSTLHDYYFLWGDEENQCAIALGFGSLYNHDYEPNARYFVDPEEETMEIYATKEIFPGDEITVTYNGHPDDPILSISFYFLQIKIDTKDVR